MIKRIAIDLDCTVANFMAGAIPKMKEMFGIEVQKGKKINRIEEAFGLKPRGPDTKWDKFGVDKEDYQKLLNIRQTLYIEGHLFRDLPLLEEDNFKLTYYLRDEGYKIYFITARTRHPTIVGDTTRWLEYNKFIYDDIFFTENKAQVCEELGIDKIIEDEPNQIRTCLAKGMDVIVMAQEWNEKIDRIDTDPNGPIGRLRRVRSWREIPYLQIMWEI